MKYLLLNILTILSILNQGTCGDSVIKGCTDKIACNFNLNSKEDDNSCTYPKQYYNCKDQCINDNDNDGICDELEIIGCEDKTACNYEQFTTDIVDCIYPKNYYTCEGNCIHDNDLDNVCDELEIPGCKDRDALNYSRVATDSQNSLCDYLQIGDERYGGIVFYIDKSGKHGYVVSKNSLSKGKWGCTENLKNVNHKNNGLLNTKNIANYCITSAANTCRVSTVGGKKDWFLPAIDQLKVLSSAVNDNQLLNNLINIENTWYWSSTQINSFSAFRVNLINGEITYGNKGESRNIISIREF